MGKNKNMPVLEQVPEVENQNRDIINRFYSIYDNANIVFNAMLCEDYDDDDDDDDDEYLVYDYDTYGTED